MTTAPNNASSRMNVAISNVATTLNSWSTPDTELKMENCEQMLMEECATAFAMLNPSQQASLEEGKQKIREVVPHAKMLVKKYGPLVKYYVMKFYNDYKHGKFSNCTVMLHILAQHLRDEKMVNAIREKMVESEVVLGILADADKARAMGCFVRCLIRTVASEHEEGKNLLLAAFDVVMSMVYLLSQQETVKSFVKEVGNNIMTNAYPQLRREVKSQTQSRGNQPAQVGHYGGKTGNKPTAHSYRRKTGSSGGGGASSRKGHGNKVSPSSHQRTSPPKTRSNGTGGAHRKTQPHRK